MIEIADQVLDQVLQHWKSRLENPTDNLPNKDTAKKVLNKLLTEIFAGESFPTDAVGIISAVSAYQGRFLGVTGGRLLGVLTERLVGTIMGTMVADHEKTPTTQDRQEAPVSLESAPSYWIRYKIDFKSFEDASLPADFDVKALIKEAWHVWTGPTKFLLVRDVADVGTSTGGILTVTNKPVGQGAGLAPVLGPGKFDHTGEIHLDLDDIKQTNDPIATFRNVATHEFGHVIGLGHDPDVTSLMNAVVKGGPTKRDIDKAIKIYGGFEKPKNLEITSRDQEAVVNIADPFA